MDLTTRVSLVQNLLTTKEIPASNGAYLHGEQANFLHSLKPGDIMSADAKPQILNSDQGCQFTSQQYINFVKQNGIRQSMDEKNR